MSFAILVTESDDPDYKKHHLYATMSPISTEAVENNGDVFRMTIGTQVVKGFVYGDYSVSEIRKTMAITDDFRFEIKSDENEWAVLT